MRFSLTMLMSMIALLVLDACNFNTPDTIPTPTVQLEVTFTPTPLPTLTPTDTPLPDTNTPDAEIVPSTQPLLATSTETATAAPPTNTPMPTETSGPFEYTIQQDDTLMYIIQLPQHGYGYDLGVAQQVVELNENMSSIDFLPPVGSTILIPRPTITATPEGGEMTATRLSDLGVSSTTGAPLLLGSNVACYDVQENDSLVSIATEYNTTLEILSGLNPDLFWFGCDFKLPSGGPSCSPNIQIGQCINVPQPTPVPSFTPTPSGNETITPTPTYPAPRMLYPVNGVTVPPGQFDLQWVAVTGLTTGDEYLVEITDMTTGQKMLQTTSSTSFRLPESFVPADGQSHTVQWRVSVARKNESGVYGYVGGAGDWRAFEWSSE